MSPAPSTQWAPSSVGGFDATLPPPGPRSCRARPGTAGRGWGLGSGVHSPTGPCAGRGCLGAGSPPGRGWGVGVSLGEGSSVPHTGASAHPCGSPAGRCSLKPREVSPLAQGQGAGTAGGRDACPTEQVSAPRPRCQVRASSQRLPLELPGPPAPSWWAESPEVGVVPRPWGGSDSHVHTLKNAPQPHPSSWSESSTGFSSLLGTRLGPGWAPVGRKPAVGPDIRS